MHVVVHGKKIGVIVISCQRLEEMNENGKVIKGYFPALDAYARWPEHHGPLPQLESSYNHLWRLKQV